MSDIQKFVENLHPSSKVIGFGTAIVMDKECPAVEVTNLYGQTVVWGLFSVDKGKFKGKLANNANTDSVIYTPLN
jgi:hypothetical protein